MTERTAISTRSLQFDIAAVREGDAGIPVVVSSDAVVEVSDGPEILVHSRDAIDLQRAPLPIIATHKGGQINVGIVDALTPSGGQLRGVARFGARDEARAFETDVMGGIIRSVSAGYRRIDGHVRKDGVLVTTRWMPTHVAMVAEPADINAGFFRAKFEPAVEALDTQQSSPPAAPAASPERKATMADTQAAAGVVADEGVQTRAAAPQASAPAQPRQGPGAVEMEKDRKVAIENLCRAYSIDEGIRDYFVGTGMSVKDVSEDLLRIVEERNKGNKAVTKLDLSEQEQRSFSLLRAIQATADKNWSNAGFELECSREIAKRLNKVPDPNKFYVPMDIQERALSVPQGQSMLTAAAQRAMGGVMRRDLTVGTTTAGGYLVGTNNVSFIEMLRNRAISFRMGARRLSGLQGNVTVPKQTAAATAVWLANEASTITESQQTFGQMALSPKSVGAYSEISRQLLLQSSPDAEGIVTSDLSAVVTLAYDAGVISGSGASGQPTGITNTAGIGSVTGTSLDYADVLEFQTDVAAANVMPASGGYVTTHAVAALLMNRVKFSGTASPLWEGNVWDGSMAGFAAMGTNQMASATMLFGDWSQVVVGEWGVLEIEVNPYANFQAGIIGVRAIVSMDCGLRYPAAFSLASSIT